MTWKITLFSELAEFRNGLKFVKNDNGKSVKIISVSDFKDYIQLKSLNDLEEIKIKAELRHEDLLQNDDLLFVRSNGNKEIIGRCMLIYVGNQEVSYSGFTIRARLKSNEVLPKFLVQLFRTSYIKSQIQAVGGGTNISNLSQSILGDLKVPIPPIAEQRKIAEILGAWDDAIALLEKLITAKRKLKQGLMQQLLTGKKRFKEFEGSEYTIKSLGEITKTFSGGTPSRSNLEYYSGNIPWIKSGELNTKNIWVTEEKITQQALKISSAKLVLSNTILVAMYGATAGVIGISRITAAINQAILAVVPNDSCIFVGWGGFADRNCRKLTI